MLRYYCSPFYVHSALHPVLDQLERAADLKKSDSPEVKLDKLEALLSQGCREVARAAALLAPLLSIPTGQRYPPLEVAPERKKALMLEALLEQLAGLAAQPLLILLEDAHWIDPTSTELFQLIIERIQRLPVLVIIAYRPSFTPPWTGFPHVTSLSLSHLSHRQATRAGRQGDPRPQAAARGPRAHRQAHRRRAALHRGADQDAARERRARAGRRRLAADRPAAAAVDPGIRCTTR